MSGDHSLRTIALWQIRFFQFNISSLPLKSPAKSAATKDKPKDKKRKSVPDLVQGSPVRRTLGSAHVSLQSLVQGGQKVTVICDFGPFRTDGEEAERTLQEVSLDTQQIQY